MWILIICLAYLFGLSEMVLAVTKRSKKKTVKIKKDSGSTITLYVIFTISMTAGFFLANFWKQSSINYFITSFGLLIYMVGLIIRWTAIIQLKKGFTVDVAINQNHQLKIDGLYRVIRHPSYLGLFLIFSGLSISMNSILSFLVITLPVFFAISYRIFVEERLMLMEFGEEYITYMKSTKKLMPGIY
jgi:protein-S-isoprenylcysteine O-methyltransferase Ste14